MLHVTVTERGGPVRRLEFEKAEITIGRVQGNDIILPKGNVSKRHARIAVEDGKLVLHDLKSTNGTYVNGRRITEPHVLRASDKIYIGDFVIVPDEGDIHITAQRGSGAAEVEADRPVEMEDPLADLARRRRSAREEAAASAPAPEAPAARVAPVAPSAAEPPRPASRASVAPPPVPDAPTPMPMPKAEPPRPSAAPAAEKPERRPSPARAPAPSPARAPAPSPAAAPSPAEWGRLIGQVRERVAERIDLSRVGIFGEETRRKVADVAREVISAGGKGNLVPAGVDADLLHSDVVAEVAGLGPLESLLGDAEVTEVLVNEPAAVFVERAGKLTRVARAFSSGEALLDVVRRLVARGGGALPEDEPVVEVRLPDGVRLTAVLPPFAPRGPSFVVRKVSRQSRDLADLARSGALSEAMARFLDLCVRARRNVVFSGGAGSGKSALLGATAALIPAGERVVTVEETAELTVPHEHIVSLEARLAAEDGREATMRDLVRAAMRLRPDWLVVGDCRGAEAFDLVQAMAGGRDGVLVCIHAHSPREALARLEAMALLAAEAPSRGAREPVVQACHVVVQLARYPDGVRRVAQVAEVAGLEGDRPVAKEIFSYLPGEGRGRFAASGYIPRFVDDLTRRGLAVDLSIFRE